MWERLFSAFYLLHAFLSIAAAVGLFRFWVRTRFWLPKYVHVLAFIAFVVMLWVLSMASADAPVNHWGFASRLLFSLTLPAIVYFFFVFYGGQRAAYDRSAATYSPCPFCGKAARVYSTNTTEQSSAARFLESQCPHCGQSLNS